MPAMQYAQRKAPRAQRHAHIRVLLVRIRGARILSQPRREEPIGLLKS